MYHTTLNIRINLQMPARSNISKFLEHKEGEDKEEQGADVDIDDGVLDRHGAPGHLGLLLGEGGQQEGWVPLIPPT